MVTIEDVRTVALFAHLPDAGLAHVADVAADIHLSPGEWAVPEGGERAVFGVLAGKIEVVKRIDGVERTLGWRLPATIFGEVPMTLGSPFPGGYRAAEPSRVLRLEPQHYYAIAAATPDVALKLSALARERIGGLQSIAAECPKPRATILGHRWDVDCAALRRFLARNEITFEWVTPDAADVAQKWPGDVPPDAACPAVLLTDGTRLDRPSARALAQALGLQTHPGRDE